MLEGVSGWVATAVGLVTLGGAFFAVRRWWLRRGAVLDVQVDRTGGGHRMRIKNTGRGSAFALGARVQVMVRGKAFDPLEATAGESPFPLNELPAGQDFHVPLILLEAADPQLKVELSWTEGTERRHRKQTFRPSYTW